LSYSSLLKGILCVLSKTFGSTGQKQERKKNKSYSINIVSCAFIYILNNKKIKKTNKKGVN